MQQYCGSVGGVHFEAAMCRDLLRISCLLYLFGKICVSRYGATALTVLEAYIYIFFLWYTMPCYVIHCVPSICQLASFPVFPFPPVFPGADRVPLRWTLWWNKLGGFGATPLCQFCGSAHFRAWHARKKRQMLPNALAICTLAVVFKLRVKGEILQEIFLS